MNSINFANPYMLFIGIALLLIIIVPYVCVIRKSNRSVKNVISLIIHIVMCVLISCVAAKTTFEKVMTETNIYCLADVSYSANNNLDTIDSYINGLAKTSPRNSKFGIVCFGKDYEELVKPGEKLRSVKENNVDGSQTNICQALEYTATLFKDNVVKRIVIISDGKETNKSNIVSVVDDLASNNIYVDAIYLDSNLKEHNIVTLSDGTITETGNKEVQISNVDYTDNAYLNSKQQANILVQSSFDTRGILEVSLNGQIIEQMPVELYKGLNPVNVDLNTATSGVNEYSFRIKVDKDHSSINNQMSIKQNVSEKLHILGIVSSETDETRLKEIYKGYNIEIFKKTTKSFKVPYTLEELCEYDEIVISNTDIREIENAQTFIDNLELAVTQYNKGLTTYGNLFIQNNEENPILNKFSGLLPIDFNKQGEKKLVAVVLDISKSMEEAGYFTMGRDATCLFAEKLLQPTDKMLVIGTAGKAGYLVRSTDVAKLNEIAEVDEWEDPVEVAERTVLRKILDRQEPLQGTVLAAGLDMAIKDLVAERNILDKEIYIISDGKDGLTYNPSLQSTYDQAKLAASQGITISCLKIGDIPGSNPDLEATGILKQIASIANGKYFVAAAKPDLENVVLTEVADEVTDALVEGTPSKGFKITSTIEKDSVLENVDMANLPEIGGFYTSSKKPSATELLTTSYETSSGRVKTAPIYSYWQKGGRVSSLTTDISNWYTSNWKGNLVADQLLNNIIETTTPEKQITSPYIISLETVGTTASVYLETPKYNSKAEAILTVTYPDGKKEELKMVFDSSRYVSTINIEQTGDYLFDVAYTIGNNTYQSSYSYNLSYEPEYDSFETFKPSNLYYMVNNNAKVSLDGVLNLENDKSFTLVYTYDFTPLFMILTVVLFVIDIIVRKITKADLLSLIGKKPGGAKK